MVRRQGLSACPVVPFLLAVVEAGMVAMGAMGGMEGMEDMGAMVAMGAMVDMGNMEDMEDTIMENMGSTLERLRG